VYGVHVEYLLFDAEKMSKSLGNADTIPDIVAKGYRPSAVRFLLLSSHYRKQLNFTWESLAGAEKGLQRLMALLTRLDDVKRPGAHPEIAMKVKEACDGFGGGLRGELTTPG